MAGRATYYSDCFEGRLTRSEEVFRQQDLTAAVDDSRWETYRGKRLLVCGQARYCVMVRVNDTGYLARAGVSIDLSSGAFGELAPHSQGVVRVKAWVLE
jgi:rare lipoprotein A (peptidoglycan hydrolase)